MHGAVLIWFVVGWAMTFCMFANWGFHSSDAFRYAGTTQWRWFLVPLACVIVPLGLPAIIYYGTRYHSKIAYYDRDKVAAREAARQRRSEIAAEVDAELRRKGHL